MDAGKHYSSPTEPSNEARRESPRIFADVSQYRIEPLREDDEFVLYRAHSKQAQSPALLLLVTASTHPARQSLKKIEREYSIRKELHATWAALPLELSNYNDRKTLVLDDPGGLPLNRLIQGPMEIRQFLRLAIGLTSALSQLHKREIIHKDVKPPNILADPATGQIHLTG